MEAAGCVAAANDVSNTQQAKESQLALGGGRGLLLRGGLEHSFFANRGSQYDIIYLLLYSLLRIFFFSFFLAKHMTK